MTPLHPTVNAALNLASTVCLAAGYYFVKRGRIEAHRRAMTAAFAISTLFLISYLVYHATAGATKYQGAGPLRAVYFGILLSHTVLAVAAAPLAIATFWRGVRGQVERHKKIARLTWPVWIYVSATGVLVYWMLYRL